MVMKTSEPQDYYDRKAWNKDYWENIKLVPYLTCGWINYKFYIKSKA